MPREYGPVLKALEAVYNVRQRLERTGAPAHRIAEAMRDEMIRRFDPLEKKYGPLISWARSITGHLPTQLPSGRVMTDYELPFHGFSGHEEVPPGYHLHLHEGLADIAAAIAVSRIRQRRIKSAKGKIRQKGRLAKRLRETGEHTLEDVLNQARRLVERRREGGNRFDLLVAIARHDINLNTHGSGSPAEIHALGSITFKHWLAHTGYGSAIRAIKKSRRETNSA